MRLQNIYDSIEPAIMAKVEESIEANDVQFNEKTPIFNVFWYGNTAHSRWYGDSYSITAIVNYKTKITVSFLMKSGFIPSIKHVLAIAGEYYEIL